MRVGEHASVNICIYEMAGFIEVKINIKQLFYARTEILRRFEVRAAYVATTLVALLGLHMEQI